MKNYLKHYGPLFMIMGCIGITTEIFFTAFYDFSSIRLMGQSYVWMFPLYGLTALTFPPLIVLLAKLKLIGRAFVKGLGIFVIEYFAGLFLEITTGSCPWKYTEGYHIHGYIRLDYYPFWVLFALLVELIISWLHPRVSLLNQVLPKED